MGKKKRKRDNSDDSIDNDTSTRKLYKERGPSGGSESSSVVVSEVLNQSNRVLFDIDDFDEYYLDQVFNPSPVVDKPVVVTKEESMMAEGSKGENSSQKSSKPKSEPTIGDVMSVLKDVSKRLSNVESKLNALDSLEKKVEGFDREMKKIWCALEDRQKKTDDKIRNIEEKAESTDFAVGQASSKIVELEKTCETFKEDFAYLKSQSMRNNLIFTNIPESANESAAETEDKIRKHLHEKLKIAKEQADQMGFERVHRKGTKEQGKIRQIVAKFTLFKEREFVRKQWKTLEGTPYRMFEQFPKDVVDKRRKLQPKLREHRSKGDTAWIAYDTLYVNGKPVRD